MYMATSANASQSAPFVASTCRAGGNWTYFFGCYTHVHACVYLCPYAISESARKELKLRLEQGAEAVSSIIGM